MEIHKQDAFRMSTAQAQAGKEMWRRTSQKGRVVQSSFNAEETAPKTWIQFVNPRGEEIDVIECELMVVGRASDPSEGILMLLAMCPKCGNHLHVREDNKTLHLDMVPYRKIPGWMQVHWRYHAKNVLGRPFSDNDLVPVVSSSEAWECDYCRSWRVRVSGGVAKRDGGAGRPIHLHSRASGGKIEF